jgi:hypothetical protein
MPENDQLNLDDQLLDSQLEAQELEVELARIRDQEQALARQRAEIAEKQAIVQNRARLIAQQREAEEQRRKLEEEQKQEIECRACDFNNHFVNVKILPDIRSDVLEVLRKTYGRQYDGYANVNRIPVDQWEAFKTNMSALHNVKVTHRLGIAEKIKAFLEAPEFLIELYQGKTLRVTPHFRATTQGLSEIPGYEFSSEHNRYSFPLSEGWRLFDWFDKYSREGMGEIIWKPDALEIVQAEVERRAKLDTIAVKSETDFDVSTAIPASRSGVY